jgi:hypothetical protein
VYFWKTGQLASEIKQKGIEENDKKNYYLATTIVTLASMFIVSISAQKKIYVSLLEFACVLIISIIGIKTTFSTNKGNSGVDYIGRMVSLSFPLLIKLILFGFVFGFIVGFSAAINGNVAFVPWSVSLFTVVLQIWYFWRLNIHLKYINA